MTVGGEFGQQVLQAIQGLGARMSSMEAQMGGLGTRMNKLETWMERLGAEFVRSHAELKSEIQEVRTELKTEIQGVRTELKTEIQGVRTELKTEIQQVRTELSTEMQEGFRQVNGRIDRVNEAWVLMSSEQHRAAQRHEELSQRVQSLEARAQHP